MPEINSMTTIVRNKSFLTAGLDDEFVLMDIELGKYYSLAGTGLRIWNLLEAPLTFKELCYQLALQYASTTEQIETEVRAFLSRLNEVGMVSVQ